MKETIYVVVLLHVKHTVHSANYRHVDPVKFNDISDSQKFPDMLFSTNDLFISFNSAILNYTFC